MPSVRGSIGLLVVIGAVLVAASYPRITVGVAIGAVATLLFQRWYAGFDGVDRRPGLGDAGTESDVGRTPSEEAAIASGRAGR